MSAHLAPGPVTLTMACGLDQLCIRYCRLQERWDLLDLQFFERKLDTQHRVEVAALRRQRNCGAPFDRKVV